MLSQDADQIHNKVKGVFNDDNDSIGTTADSLILPNQQNDVLPS